MIMGLFVSFLAILSIFFLTLAWGASEPLSVETVRRGRRIDLRRQKLGPAPRLITAKA
jgi:hypothetical protein